jgi:hypothetical protein
VSVISFSGSVTSPATNERIKRRISFGILSMWHIGADSMKRGQFGCLVNQEKRGPRPAKLDALTKPQNLSGGAVGAMIVICRQGDDGEYNHQGTRTVRGISKKIN